jgi:hypothetical protein
VLAIAGVSVLFVLTGCGEQSAPTAGPRPLDQPAPGRDPASTTSSTATTSTSAPGPSVPTPSDLATSDDAAAAVVDEVLASYGAVLDELSAEPTGAPAPGTAGRQRWDDVVVAGSALSDDVLSRLHRRATEERVVVVPGPEGVAYRHRATAIRSATDTRIDFEWCGWSPGIARSIDTGEVVDDEVAHSSGTGQLTSDGTRWRLAALDQLDLVLLGPGAGDPCSAAAATDEVGAP